MNISEQDAPGEQCRSASNADKVAYIDLVQAIAARHSVRKYKHKPLSQDLIHILQKEIEQCNEQGGLHIQLVLNETKAFTGMMSYGQFSGVENYFAMVGSKGEDLDERIGYYGEKLVLLAQQLGLNTCWVGVSYRKVSDAYIVAENEKLVCVIALGYGETQGEGHRIKSVEDVSNASDITPKWFRKGVEAALLAPSSFNQQKFSFEYLTPLGDSIHWVRANKGTSMVGYTHLDLGIAKLHFEIGAGKENFAWK